MAFTNYETKEINSKIIFFGPREAGKTENLRAIFTTTSQEVQAGLLELQGKATATRFFDFLPVSIGHVGDYHLKLHLYTLPPFELYETVPMVLLKGIDGFVFVADSQVDRFPDNIAALQELKVRLQDLGYHVADMPRVIQYNKRDLKEIMPVEVLRDELNPGLCPDVEAIATQGEGVMKTLQLIAQQVIKKLSTG